MSIRRILALLPEAQRRHVKDTARLLRYRAIRSFLSYSPEALEKSLRRLGLGDGSAVMMHSAFSPLNGFEGDAQHVIDCVLDVIGPRGHLFMVSLPYAGSASAYLGSGQTFDVRRTPSQMGIVSESFRRRRDVIRSANPLHPVLAWGPRAEWVVAGHETLSHSCGPGSPFEKMLELGATALFFDVGIEVLTFMHYLEDRFASSAPVRVYTDEAMPVELVDRAGLRRRLDVYPFSREAMAARNFALVYEEMGRRSLIQRERVGNTVLQVAALRSVLDVGAELVDRGAHIYGRQGEAVRVRPATGGGPAGIGPVLREELASGRVIRHLDRLLQRALAPAVRRLRDRGLPSAARREARHDRRGAAPDDPGAAAAATAAVDWLCEAQDHSTSEDGGVAREYSLIKGWSSSTPADTARAAAALLPHALRRGDERLLERCRRMLDFLVTVQLADGGFRAGAGSADAERPASFATGHALRALTAGAAAFRDARYRQAMHRAAGWLLESQDTDGWWRMQAAPDRLPDEASYGGAAVWGLFDAARLAPGRSYERAAIRSVDWLLRHQRANGWFGRSHVEQPTFPLTDAVAHVFRAVVEAAHFTGDERYLSAANATADSVARVIGLDGFLPGRLRSDWSGAVSWASPGGTAHLAHALLLLHDQTARPAHLAAAERANRFVRRSIHFSGTAGTVGGVKGSLPVDGDHRQYAFTTAAATCIVCGAAAELARAAAPRGARHA